jgi:hypothetical protein
MILAFCYTGEVVDLWKSRTEWAEVILEDEYIMTSPVYINKNKILVLSDKKGGLALYVPQKTCRTSC